MKESPILDSEFAASVIAVPPLARRADYSLIRVLHDAVTFSKIVDMGPILPLLSSTPLKHHAKIDHATQVLLAFERQFAQKPTSH